MGIIWWFDEVGNGPSGDLRLVPWDAVLEMKLMSPNPVRTMGSSQA